MLDITSFLCFFPLSFWWTVGQNLKHILHETQPSTHTQWSPNIAMDEHHTEQVNLSLKVHVVFHAQQLPQTSKSLKVDSVCAQRWPKSHGCSSGHHPSAALDKWKQCIPWSHSFDAQLQKQNSEWHAPLAPRKNTARCSEGTLQVMHIVFFSQNGLTLNHPVPNGTTLKGQYYYTPLQDGMRPIVHRKQLELLEDGVILLQDNVTPGTGRCWHILFSRSHAMWLLLVCTCERTSSG